MFVTVITQRGVQSDVFQHRRVEVMRQPAYAFQKFLEPFVNSNSLRDRVGGVAREISSESADFNTYERKLLAQIVMKLARQTAAFLLLRMDQPGGQRLNLLLGTQPF